jgi:hypothetical protein
MGTWPFAKQLVTTLGIGLLLASGICTETLASNHLDTRAVIENPQANIGDMYAWIAQDGRHLNLVMDIVGSSFSDKLSYIYHIDSGPGFGKTTATTTIVCRFPEAKVADCRLGDVDRGPLTIPEFMHVKPGRRMAGAYAGPVIAHRTTYSRDRPVPAVQISTILHRSARMLL